jgi:sugar lactone lactonase YvrE
MIQMTKVNVGSPICIAATGDACGEGILWQAATESVYWTDINRFLVHRYSSVDRAIRTWYFSEPVTCVLSTVHKDTLALVMGSSVVFWNPATDARHPPIFHLPDWPAVRCNDAAVDPNGDLWVGSMRNNVGESGESSDAGGNDGVLYRVSITGEVKEFQRNIGISNTLVWSPDDSRFYFGDTLQNQIWQYNYDLEDGSIGSRKPFFQDFDRGLPDGSAIDIAGYLWNCRYGGGCIVRVDPNGEVDMVVEVPVSNPTNCTFGGIDGTTLFVTSASADPGKWERFGGCLFALDTDIRGKTDGVLRTCT